MSDMPFGRVLGLGAISAVAHALIVIGAGVALGGNAERLQALANQYELVVGIGLAIVVLAYVGRWLYRRHVRRRDAGVSGTRSR
jgi:membrane protein DedA with SNARE-associated domain